MIAHSGAAAHLVMVGGAMAALAAYGWMWRASRSAGVAALAAWAVGLLAVVCAMLPTVERLAERSFTGHMVQHLALIVVAAPFLVAAHPARLVLHRRPAFLGSTAGERRSMRAAHRWGAVGAPVMFLGVLFATHLTGVYDLALRNRWVHDVEHLAYLGSAVGLWAAVLAPNRTRAVGRIGAAFAVIAGSAALGVVLTSADRPLVATYARRLGDGEALDDQQLAASLMWVGGMAASLPLLMVAVWSWASSEQRAVERAEQLTDTRH